MTDVSAQAVLLSSRPVSLRVKVTMRPPMVELQVALLDDMVGEELWSATQELRDGDTLTVRDIFFAGWV